MQAQKSPPQTLIYQAKSGEIEFRGDTEDETIWGSLSQIADLFGRDKSVISRHIKKIFATGELRKDSTVAEFATVQTEGKREVVRNIEYYNLDVILSVGYRVDSQQATKFRIWATDLLRHYLLDGYNINKARVISNYQGFLDAVANIQRLLPGNYDSQSTLELIKLFAATWLNLDDYDRANLPKVGATKREVALTLQQLESVLSEFRSELISRQEASDIFGQEKREGSVAGILGNVLLSVGGRDVYETVEEKAANLLYFLVKDHPFVDGNKRCGAFLFLWLINSAGIFNAQRMSPQALTALTLLVAESLPEMKDQMIGTIILLLQRN